MKKSKKHKTEVSAHCEHKVIDSRSVIQGEIRTKNKLGLIVHSLVSLKPQLYNGTMLSPQSIQSSSCCFRKLLVVARPSLDLGWGVQYSNLVSALLWSTYILSVIHQRVHHSRRHSFFFFEFSFFSSPGPRKRLRFCSS